jgi:hypothetical protein
VNEIIEKINISARLSLIIILLGVWAISLLLLMMMKDIDECKVLKLHQRYGNV